MVIVGGGGCGSWGATSAVQPDRELTEEDGIFQVCCDIDAFIISNDTSQCVDDDVLTKTMMTMMTMMIRQLRCTPNVVPA